MSLIDIKSLISASFSTAILGEDPESTPLSLIIDGKSIVEVCELLHRSERTYFDQLSCLTGIDNGPEADTMEVIYNLYSIPNDLHLMLKVLLNRNEPSIDSLSHIWRNANWYEREVFDLLGIHFNHHPDLRRILLPSDWEGYPLRKDYEEQEYYHGITVKYDRDKKPDDIPQITQ